MVTPCALPYARCYIDTEDPVVQEDLMEFRLLYQGPLYASGNDNPRASHKHDIRKAFHPQLKRQWRLHKGLKFFADRNVIVKDGDPNTEDWRFENGLIEIGKQHKSHGLECVPMVISRFSLRCSLDVV